MKLKSFILAGALGTVLLITDTASVHALCSDDCNPDCYEICLGNCIPGLPCYCNATATPAVSITAMMTVTG